MKIIWALLASALLCVIFLASAVDAAEPRKMIVPYTPLTGASTPFWIAIEEKLFQKYGLEIAPLFISAGSSAIVPAMTAGQFDIGAVGGGAVVLNRFGGGDLITIGAQTGVYTTDCFAKPEIKSIRDLKGRTIGVTRFGTSTHFAGLVHVAFRRPQTNRCRFYSNRGQFGSYCRAFERQSGRGHARLSCERRGAEERLSSAYGSGQEAKMELSLPQPSPLGNRG